jgi:hypothetical protein
MVVARPEQASAYEATETGRGVCVLGVWKKELKKKNK